MRKILLLLLLAPSVLWAGLGNELFYRAHGATSVVLRNICVPEFTGEEIFAIDFETTNLTITARASGDAASQTFTYTGGDIDEYAGTPPAWGDPTTDAIELEAAAPCFNLHVRDEVFSVTGASEWTFTFTDSTTDDFMDFSVQVLAIGTAAQIQAAAQAAFLAEGGATEANVDATKAFASSAATDAASAVGEIQAVSQALGDPVDDTIALDIAAVQSGLDTGVNVIALAGCTITGDGGATPFDVTCP